MTDNRTTEQRISKPLLGFIKHQRNRGYIDAGQAQWLFNIADEIDAKHEQAIAATLGSGTLTAEQVERVIHDCSTYASYDGCTYYASGIKLQAIADELNTELGSGTCEDISNDPTGFECSKCGVSLAYDEISYNHDWDDPATVRFCPNCGKRVSA